jgi:hypothetical protein
MGWFRAFAAEGISEDEYFHAVNSMVTKTKFFPEPSEVIDFIRGPAKHHSSYEAIATKASHMITNAIPKYGFYHADLAREALGELLWKVVSATSNWATLCEVESDQITYLQNEIRKVALTIISHLPIEQLIREIPENPILPSSSEVRLRLKSKEAQKALEAPKQEREQGLKLVKFSVADILARAKA